MIEKRPVTGACSVKQVMLFLVCCFAWTFGACKQIPEKTDEYPVGELPPAQSGEAPEAPEIARSLHGQVAGEGGEETSEASETLPDEAPGEEVSDAQASDTDIAEETEIVLPEPVPPAEPQQITDIPRLAEVPQIPAEQDPRDESAVQTDPAPPVTRIQEPPQPSRPPPPVPEFIRPSEPVVSGESAEEPPPRPVFDLPARPMPPPDDSLVYSRIVTAYVGQYIEIPFRGPGWVYLGELGSRRGVYYDSRRIDDEGMVFVFRANEEGSYSLKFNRQDFIRDYVINDYVQVKVLPPPEITGSVWHSTAVVPDRVYAAPRWPPADMPPGGTAAPVLPEAAGQAAQPAPVPQPEAPATPPASAQPAPQSAATQPAASQAAEAADAAQVPDAGQTLTGGALPETADPGAAASAVLPAGSLPDAYLARAKEAYDAGRIAETLETLDQFRAAYPGGSDEAYWLYGQALEASGPNRDIRLALDYYRRLTREYPQSSRYDAARRRIAYLERFYFNIQ
ncbi:MAG: hypothetical protein LBP69_09475 [Treponema sp.]|nr:hypothetical protein [Treponema sp.]